MDTAPLDAIPPIKCKARKLLSLLIENDYVSTETILKELGMNNRSQLQQLTGDDYLYWNILPIHDSNGLIVARSLDKRHLQDAKSDREARRERRLQLKMDSLKQATQEARRIPEAYRELEAANDDLFDPEVKNSKKKKTP